MNIKLEQLISQTSELSPKDIYEIRQMFMVFDNDKKQSIINNWDIIVWKIVKIKDDLKQQQEILLWKAIENIELKIQIAKEHWYKKGVTDEILNLKNLI